MSFAKYNLSNKDVSIDVPTSKSDHHESLAESSITILGRAKILIAILLFIIILFAYSDFSVQHILSPLGLAHVDTPTDKGYYCIAGFIALIYLFIDLIYSVC